MTKIIPFFSAALVLVVAGCGKKESAPAADSAAPAAASAADAPAATDVRTVELTGNDQMKYNINSIEAKAGEKLRVVFTNVGSLPKQAMGHNWTLLKHGVKPDEFALAAATAMKTEYIPQDRLDQIIAHTKLLGPKEKDEVTFDVPSEPGEYVYLCTFPGHFMAGMKGVLVVK